MKTISIYLILPLLCLLIPDISLAQDGNSQVSYSNLALQFSSQGNNGDPSTGYLSSVAKARGYGSYLDNPASIALLEGSFFNFGMSNRQQESQNSYLGNSLTTQNDTWNLGSLGFIYAFPTSQGSFVVGGGYTTVNDTDEILRVSGRNNISTITDAFKDPGSDYYDIAFNTYAIDWGDVDSTYLESIFRVGLPNYPGIDQDVKVTYQNNLSDYTVFFGTEFQKNLFFGISAGITGGTYTYRRDFLEQDSQNDYNYTIIPSDQSETGTDIDQILVHDEIDAEVISLNLRTGLLYEVTNWLNLGVSYVFPTTMVIQEEYYSSIRTELDDGSTPFESDFASSSPFEYRVTKPGELKAGLALMDLANFDLSLSAEMINYSNLEVDLITGNGFSFNQEVDFQQQQMRINEFMADNYKRVFNFKAGLDYRIHPEFEIKTGFAYLGNKSKAYEADRQIYVLGLTGRLTENIVLDLNGQYATWKDRSVLYTYYDDADAVNYSESIDQKIRQFSVKAGIRILF